MTGRLDRWSYRGLLALAFVLVFATGPVLYASTVIDDEDAFVALTDDVVAHPEIRRELAQAAAAVTVDVVSSDETLTEPLPDSIRAFTVPLTQLATAQLAEAAFVLLETGVAVDARRSALRELHSQLTADDDELTIDLRAMLVRTSRELGGPAVGAGVAKLVADQDVGRYTVAEAGSTNAALVALIRLVPAVGTALLLASLLTLLATVAFAPDRRRAMVASGLVVAGGSLVALLSIAMVAFTAAAIATGGSALGAAVAEVVVADFSSQQQGLILVGLTIAAVGLLLGQRRSAVALRALPFDLWHRRPEAANRLADIVVDNPALSRIVVWLGGALLLLSWTAPTGRVVVTVILVTLLLQAFVWIATAPGPVPQRWRQRLHISTEPCPDGILGRLNGNLAVLTVLVFLFWPEWDRGVVVGAFVVGAALQVIVDLAPARSMADEEAEATDAAGTTDAVDSPPGAAPERPWLWYGLGGAAITIAVLIGLASTNASVERSEASAACNGHVDLCDRRIDEVVFAGSHNAMSSTELGWELAMQTGDMVAQLDHGIRALLIDALYWDSDGQIEGGEAAAGASAAIEAALGDDQPRPGTWLCHGFCALGATDLTAGLADIDAWLAANPREVLLIVVQDEVTFDDLSTAFELSGLRDRVHAHQPGQPFPTLGELIEADERVLVYGENQGSPGEWFQNAYASAFTETPFTFAVRSEFNCQPNRGQEDNPLLLINHWITTGIPVREAAVSINSRDVLLERVEECQTDRGRSPTVLATDFVETGDLVEVVAELNGLSEASE